MFLCSSAYGLQRYADYNFRLEAEGEARLCKLPTPRDVDIVVCPLAEGQSCFKGQPVAFRSQALLCQVCSLWIRETSAGTI